MRVVSMVPSWTETLLACGANVVGRTRYCVHPESASGIATVGGTKDIDWKKTLRLEPDLLLLDREENPKAMADEAAANGIKIVFATHITSVKSVAPELTRLADELGLSDVALKLRLLASRWSAISSRTPVALATWNDLPGVLRWIRKPTTAPGEFAYLIWRKPWMVTGRETFIASMLEEVGLAKSGLRPAHALRYPEIELEEFTSETVLLFSSEPYPFAKKNDWEREINNPAAVVDGESFSWFGLRSLEFLEKVKLGATSEP